VGAGDILFFGVEVCSGDLSHGVGDGRLPVSSSCVSLDTCAIHIAAASHCPVPPHSTSSSSSSSSSDLLTTLAADGRFTRFSALLQTAGLASTLSSLGPWTLLDLTDAALDDKGTDLTLSVAARKPQKHLVPLLSYYIISGTSTHPPTHHTHPPTYSQ